MTAAVAPSAARKSPGLFIYLFFGVHMAMFGASGFFMAYGDNPADLAFLYMHGGFAILVYLVFYLSIFGRDQVKWMLINAALGVFGIYAQVGWLLARFGKRVEDFPWQVHVIPFLWGLLTLMTHVAWTSRGRQVVLRGAAPDWPSGQAARRRMAATGGPPGGPALRTRATASSLRCVSTYAPSLFLAAHARRAGAACVISVNRPSVLYTFLLRQFLIDLTASRDKPGRRAIVDAVYVVLSLVVYGLLLARTRGVG